MRTFRDLKVGDIVYSVSESGIKECKVQKYYYVTSILIVVIEGHSFAFKDASAHYIEKYYSDIDEALEFLSFTINIHIEGLRKEIRDYEKLLSSEIEKYISK